MQDKRSHKVAFLAHCLLNQNAKVPGLAGRPAMIEPLVELLLEAGVGLLQLPCPECLRFGLDRPLGEDVREQYDEPAYRALCAELAARTAGEAAAYLAHGDRVVCVLGVEGSPSCSVDRVPTRGGLVPGSGLFMAALAEAFRARGLAVPILGMPERGDIELALAAVRRLA